MRVGTGSSCCGISRWRHVRLTCDKLWLVSVWFRRFYVACHSRTASMCIHTAIIYNKPCHVRPLPTATSTLQRHRNFAVMHHTLQMHLHDHSTACMSAIGQGTIFMSVKGCSFVVLHSLYCCPAACAVSGRCTQVACEDWSIVNELCWQHLPSKKGHHNSTVCWWLSCMYVLVVS